MGTVIYYSSVSWNSLERKTSEYEYSFFLFIPFIFSPLPQYFNWAQLKIHRKRRKPKCQSSFTFLPIGSLAAKSRCVSECPGFLQIPSMKSPRMTLVTAIMPMSYSWMTQMHQVTSALIFYRLHPGQHETIAVINLGPKDRNMGYLWYVAI